jgi:hypothetical protein
MDDPKPGKNFAVSHGPVNSRLIAPQALPADDTSPLVLARLEAVQARLRLGTPLAERLGTAQRVPGNAGPLSARQVVSVVGATVSGVGLTLGLIQSAVLVIGASTVFLCGFGAVAYLAGKARRQAGGDAVAPAGPLVESKDIALLDAAMEKLVAAAPQETVDRLTDLKEQISRSLALLASTHSHPGSLDEDAFFVRECVRRYLPDSINGFLRVPLKDRESLQMEDGKTAQDLLHDQFDMLKGKLHAKENRLTQLAGESLMQQQRFLAAKTGTRN